VRGKGGETTTGAGGRNLKRSTEFGKKTIGTKQEKCLPWLIRQRKGAISRLSVHLEIVDDDRWRANKYRK